MSIFYKELYSDMIMKVKCGSYHGQKIKAKPLLLYSIVMMIEEGLVHDNRVYFNKMSEDFYKKVSDVYSATITPYFKPFYYLQFDGFWHLKGKKDRFITDRPSPKFIRENIEYAYLDNALWDLLQEANIREYFKSIIESNYLK
ncbi:MAG: hypothetical protein LUC49_06755 [Prevotella sp.]|nr:hypothetical protein [Prevotella sp.]